MPVSRAQRVALAGAPAAVWLRGGCRGCARSVSPSTALSSGTALLWLCCCTPRTGSAGPRSSPNALQRGTDTPLGVPETAYSWLPGKLPPGLLFRH